MIICSSVWRHKFKRLLIRINSIMLCSVLLFAATSAATSPQMRSLPFTIDTNNQETLQRGAKVYMNYCSGCHSLKYLRYNKMAKSLGLINFTGAVRNDLMKNNLQFTSTNIYDPIVIAMPADEAQSWFGVSPPDLSLIMRSRGSEWVYSFLLGFYEDRSRPFHTNNIIFPNVGMPNVLSLLQGRVLLDSSSQTLVLVDPGQMTKEEFKQTVADLVQFLVFVGEPIRAERVYLGWWVLVFFMTFITVYALYVRIIRS